jgi:hypothetical protein
MNKRGTELGTAVYAVFLMCSVYASCRTQRPSWSQLSEIQIAWRQFGKAMDSERGMLPGIFRYNPSRRQTPLPLQVFVRFMKNWRKNLPVGTHQVRQPEQ